MRILRPIRTLAPLVAATTLASSGLAQATDAQIRADLEYARGLAADWGFTDLSEEILADVEEDAPEKMAEEIALVKCQIFRAGAKAVKRDAEVRHDLYEKALEAYRDFIDEYEYSPLRDQAEREFVDASGEYGRSLALEMEEATGQRAEELRETLQQTLEAAVDRTGDLIATLQGMPDRTQEETVELYRLMLNRGNMLTQWAKTQESGTANFEFSLQTLEELALLAGEDNPWGLQAYIGMGNNYMAQREFQYAADFFTFVCDKAITKDLETRNDWLAGRLPQQEAPPSAAEIEQRFLFVQLGIPGAVESLRKSGNLEEAVDWGLYFYNVWKSEGLTLHDGLGHIALLGVGRTLLEAGGYVGGSLTAGEGEWFSSVEAMEEAGHRGKRNQATALDIALQIAMQVNREMRGTVLQVRAQKLISDIVSRPGQKPDPAILFEAAEGEYFSDNNPEAIAGFKSVLASLDGGDHALRVEFGTRTLYRLGATYRRQDRHLEAAVTFEEALDHWPEDPEFTPRCAQDMLRAARSFERNTGGDPLAKDLVLSAETWVENVGAQGVEDIKFAKAQKVYDRASNSAEFATAQAQFAAIGPEAKSYEKAKVYVGICDFKAHDYDSAIEVFRDYLEGYVEDPKNAVTTAVTRARRQEARAMATLYWGLSRYAQARLRGDESLWRAVIERLNGYEDEFPAQPSYAATAMYRRLLAHLELNEVEEALAIHEDLLERFPDEKSTGAASYEAYKVISGKHEAATDEETKRALLEQMARLLRLGNEAASSPNYTNLRREAMHWIELGEWATARDLLERIVERFGNDPEHVESIQRYALPDLGLAYLKLRDVQRAAEVLKPLIEAEIATAETARTYARALCGWMEPAEDGDGYVIVPGVGGTDENFNEGTDILIQLAGSMREEKWTSPWYELKLDLAFAYWRWGEIDSAKKESAKGQIENLRADVGSDFGLIEDDEIRARFLWLRSQVR